MVLTRSMAARRTLLALPYDMVVEIAGLVAATSPNPMEDLCSLRGTCQTLRAVCMEGTIRRRVALKREEWLKWIDPNRYLTLVDKLAAAGNPEACFVLGLRLVFTLGRTDPAGITNLRQAAAADHKVAAYVLGVLHYGDKEAEQYMRQVEGKGEDVAHGWKPQANRTNQECMRCREQAVDTVREVTWKVDGMIDPVPVPPPPPEASCKGSGCGVADAWTGSCAVFCSDRCIARHEYIEFFSRVSSFLN